MSRKLKEQEKVANLVIFCNEKDSQQYLVFDLKYGDNIIGKNSNKCQIVFSFTNDIDDVNTKISIDDDDYTIEDLNSQKGTFKIKSDNSLIRLKPNKSYDLSNNQTFYIGKYKCMFQIVKPGRAMAFSLSPSDLLNSQKNNISSTTTTATNNKKGIKKVQSIEDDIEDFTVQPSKQGNKRGQTSSKIIQNKMETENIDEDEENPISTRGLNKLQTTNGSLAKKPLSSQKNFVKSKGQLAKSIKGNFKNIENENQEDTKKDDNYEVIDTQLNDNKMIDDDEDCELQFSFPKSFKKNNQEEKEINNKKRSNITRKNTLESQVETYQYDEESMKLDSQFLKRIQEKLKNNTQQNEQRLYLNDLVNKYNSQKQQQKSQDIPYDDNSDDKLPILEKQESENYWQPQTSRRNNSKIESSLESQKTKQKSKTASAVSNKAETETNSTTASKKLSKQKEEQSQKVNNKLQSTESKKQSENTATSKKGQKIELKKDEKMEKLKQQAEAIIKNMSNSAKKEDLKSKEKDNVKSTKTVKEDNKKKQKIKGFDDSTSISNDKSDDEEYSIDEEQSQVQSQKITNIVSTRKRKADEMMTQVKQAKTQPKKEEKKNKSVNEPEKKQKIEKKEENPKENTKKAKSSDSKAQETPQKQSTKKVEKKDNSKNTKMEVEVKEKSSKISKSKNDKLLDSKDKIEEEELVSTRRSTRKTQQEEPEKIIEERKSTKKSVSKASVAKKSTKKAKEIEEESEESNQEEEMIIEGKKPIRKSVRKSVSKADILEKNEEKKSVQNKLKAKKEEEIKSEIKGKGKGSKKVDEKVSSTKAKNLIRRTKSSLKELLQLQQSAGNFMDIPRRNKYRIIFSNSTITDEEKKEMSTYGVKILNDFHNANDFNILVTDEFKRRLKTLVALNKGYPIVSQNWIKQCIKEDKLVHYDAYIINKVDKVLAKQHNFDLKKSLKNQKDHPEGILQNVTFVCQNSFDSLGKEEIRKLVESAGGTFLYDKPKHTSAYFLSDKHKTEYNEQINKENHIVLDIEGLFQTCLLQYNVLDDYIIINQEKKTTKKK